MTEIKKFTQEELDQIQKIRDENARIISDSGQIELELLLTNQKIDLLQDTKEKISEGFKQLQEQEKQLVEKLNKKYGTGTVDISNGEFTPSN